jgi:protein SCO1/2
MLVVAVAALLLASCVTPADEVGGSDADNLGFQGRLLTEPVAKPDVVFTDTEGQPFDLRAETDGELTMVLFGYTSCPDICPIHMGAIAPAIEDARLATGNPNVVFVGVDTARDTPERMRDFLNRFDRRFVGLTATPEEIDRAMAQVGLPPVVIDPEGEGGDSYAVGHPSQILVFTADNLAHIAYPFGTREQAWAEDLPRLSTIDWSAP